MRLLILLLAALPAFGQINVPLNITIHKNAVPSVNLFLFNTFDKATTLTAAIGINDTTMTLATGTICTKKMDDGTTQPVLPCMVRIEDEAVRITARTGGSVTAMTRGVSATTKVAHAASTPVRALRYQSPDDLVRQAALGRLKELRDLIFSAFPPAAVATSSATIAAEETKIRAEKDAAVVVQ